MGKPVYTIVLDKLDLLLNGTIPQLDNMQNSNRNTCNLSDDIIFIKTKKHRNPSFYTCYEVYLQNQPFAYLYYNYNRKYRYGCNYPMILHIQNHILYAEGLANKLEIFLKSFNSVEFFKYDKIDIAIDGYDFVDLHTNYSISKKYKRKQLVQFTSLLMDDKTKEIVNCRVGSDQSDKYLVLYNKQQELNKSKKQYIRDLWRKNGLQEYKRKSIDRIEGRFKSNALVDFKKGFHILEDPKELASFFQSEFEGRILFNGTRSKKRISIIDWSVFETVKIQKIKNTKKLSDCIYSSKVSIRKLFMEYSKNQKEYYLKSMMEIIEENNLIEWTCNRINTWLKESHRLN